MATMSELCTTGVVQFTPKIPLQPLPDIKLGEFFDVFVGDIITPRAFFLQLVQLNLPYDLDDFVDEMFDTYYENTDTSLDVSWEDVKVGLCCAAIIDNKWLRVVVVKVNSITDIQLKLIDFGGIYPVHLLCLKWLLSQFCSLPAQALPAQLAYLAPPHGSCSWPRSSGIRMLDLTRAACESGGLVAKLVGWGQEGKLEVVLYDTVTNSERHGVDLSNVLVEEGLARLVTKLPNDIKYLEEMLTTNKTYKYRPLRCPRYLITEDEQWMGNVSSNLSEATSIKSQLKSLLNIQNKVHSLVSKNLVTDPEDKVFTRMTSLQTEYQALLAKLLSGRSKATHDQEKAIQEASWNMTKVREDPDPDYCQDNEAEQVEDNDVTVIPVSCASGDTVHGIRWRGDFWLISTEISSLVPQWRGYDLLHIMLARKKLSLKFEFESVEVDYSEEEALFQQMIVGEVRGLLTKAGKLLDSVILYKLDDLPGLLNVFNVKNSVVEAVQS